MTFIPRYRPNKVFDITPTVSDSAVEPVSLDEAKTWLIVTYTDDDDLITELIKQCRDAVEQFCNISIVEKTIVVNADLYEEIELPMGPIRTGSVEVKVKTGQNATTGANEYDTLAATGYSLDGEGFKIFTPSRCGRYRLSYPTGITGGQLTAFGQSLKLDLLRIIAYCYEHRGDEALSSLQGGLSRPKSLDEALELFASKYKRMCWI